MSTFAAALSALLTERGMSQAELGRRLDITAQAVSSWIKAGIKPSRDRAIQIEDELAVKPRGSLLRLLGYSLEDGQPLTPEALIRADPTLDAEDKRVLLRILRVLRERHSTESAQALVESNEGHP